jgi:hypothetical protein
MLGSSNLPGVPKVIDVPMVNVPESLVLYCCIPRGEAEECVGKGGPVRPGHCMGWEHDHIALRSTVCAAWDRVCKFFEDPRKHDFVVLQLTLTLEGQMYATTSMQGAAPLLRKLVFENSNRDWGVWHWSGDLPLTLASTSGGEVLSVCFVPVPENL